MLVGDLDYAGLHGKVYTPAEGKGVPAVAFGHDWMTDIKHYHATLRHLASWGIAVAAPNTEKGFSPDHRGFSADLESAMQILAGVKLGHGNVTVNPKKIGVIGHGMGAGCAILSAAGNEKVRAVATIYPSVTAPSNTAAAQNVDAPGLIIASGDNALIEAGNPVEIANAWKGDVAYREIENGNQQGFSENTMFKLLVGLAKPQTSARETARGLVTGYLLHQLDGQKKFSAFSEPMVEAKNVQSLDGDVLQEKLDEQQGKNLSLPF